MLVCVLVLLLFPDPLLNRFIKPRITKAFVEAYPAYSIRIGEMSYSVLKSRFGFSSVAVRAVDGTFSSTMGPLSVSRITWMHLLWGGTLGPNDLANLELNAQDIKLNFPQSQYELRCDRLRVSMPDSEMTAQSLKVHPLIDDEKFFKASESRRTRFSIVTPRCSVTGLSCLQLLQGKMYRARSVQIHDAFFDVLVNKDKPYVSDTPPLMLNEILASIKAPLQIHNLSVVNARLKYGERIRVDAEPAIITFDSVHVLAEGIANHGHHGANLVIHAHGKFMNAGTMNVLMSIPVASPDFSYQYSGSLSKMDVSSLNVFLETAEQMRIKAGFLQEATFEISVASGHASGYVRALYSDLTFAVINKYTGSEKGILDRIASLIANNFKFRKTNLPDKLGTLKIGEVNYTRKRDDFFLEFTWFALRSGVGNVVGF